jgi:ubiquinone/menaquinone biosynthesis C-methylase UbiE
MSCEQGMAMATSSKGYVGAEYLGILAELLEKQKQQTYAHMHIEKGHRVLDVGCGSGTDTIPLGRLVGPAGAVFGVDFDPAMLVEAEQRAEKAHMSGWVHHKEADATVLPFESDTFDSCRSERLFQHLLDPRGVFAEMMRVTKKNGWIVVLDTDWASFSIDSDEVEIERRLAHFMATETRHNGFSGRRLFRFFKEQGLGELSIEVFSFPFTSYPLSRYINSLDKKEAQALAAKVITEEELQRWRASLERAEAGGFFFGYGCMILVAGRKN